MVEQTGQNVIYYIRDDSNNLIGFIYNNTLYYYVKNLSEDIIGIMDSNYQLIANYSYDAYGKLLKITDQNGIEITDYNHVAYKNPFRYRSYYYDSETGLYYLNSRYYNPEWARFINLDGVIGGNEDVISHNLFVYCLNNPINNYDSSGAFFKKIINGVVKMAKTIVNKVLTTVSNVVGKILKADLSADLFNKSVNDYNTPISKNIKQKIENKTKNTRSIKDAVSGCILSNNGKDFKNCVGSTEFESGDLYYAIHNFNYNVSGTKLLDKSWNITITLSDKYDFTEHFENPKKFGQYANNVGYHLSNWKLIHDYEWDVTYSLNYQE